MTETSNPLVGMFLHTFDEEGVVSRQGEIKAAVGDDIVLVQWFEWFAGTPSAQTLVRLSDLVEPKARFYASDTEPTARYPRYRQLINSEPPDAA